MATIGSTTYLFSNHPGVRGNFSLALDLTGQPGLKDRVAILKGSLVSQRLDVAEEMRTTLTEFDPSTFRLSVCREAPPLDQESLQTILVTIYEANETIRAEDFSFEARSGVEGSFLVRPSFSVDTFK